MKKLKLHASGDEDHLKSIKDKFKSFKQKLKINTDLSDSEKENQFKKTSDSFLEEKKQLKNKLF